MLTHRHDLILASAFLCLLTGMRSSGCCSYGNKQIRVKQIRWIWERRIGGRVARASVEEYVRQERMSGQVDWELEISCQTLEFMPSSLESPRLPPGTQLFLSNSFTLFLCTIFPLDGIEVSRRRLISPPLLLPIHLSRRHTEGDLTAAWAAAISQE